MTQVRRTVSLSRELDINLAELARKRSESLSALLETLLREHPLVVKEIEFTRLDTSISDFGARPFKGSALYEAATARLQQASSSGEGSPKTRRKGAAHP